jgi:hypothetical protein
MQYGEQQNRGSKQLRHRASGDDISEQTSKRAVSSSVEHSAKTGFTLRLKSADCQITFFSAKWAA